ncbi:hypothetical protein GUITHDRAFT_114539 [Guillardia theta CCMP2712]|uniref:Thioredoxin domain-containing protein n=1 Tax=Guillardia theta (strain CCMP2712) TaxID=905079 RepID=L1ITC7_GUITC|nr:hypothetical protein GUITHDRAFT_114539 [Guillardia theta CCMP2712]EKX39337.1 hypothetical protein GUITHDRAFT_114539 [Guillardia theta CCMP2712]|eukprot:XP_005826317.1 hypothetical protein GUITHDRAFT_114539 [Guillardia theta CCMP2712]
MASLLLRIFACSFLLVSVSTQESVFKAASVIDDFNVNDFISSGPWCGYCKQVLPVWDRLADQLHGDVVVAKVNLEDNTQIQHRFRRKIKGYPTMLLFNEGRMYVYTGSRLAPKDQTADIPKDPATLSIVEFTMEKLEDFLTGTLEGYQGIWNSFPQEFTAAVVTSFSLGASFGFLVKVGIDSLFVPRRKIKKK